MGTVTNIADKRKAKVKTENEVNPDEMSTEDFEKIEKINKKKKEKLERERFESNRKIKREYRLKPNDPNNKR